MNTIGFSDRVPALSEVGRGGGGWCSASGLNFMKSPLLGDPVSGDPVLGLVRRAQFKPPWSYQEGKILGQMNSR